MRAYRLLDWQKPDYADVEVPQPERGQVLVRVGGVGGSGDAEGRVRCHPRQPVVRVRLTRSAGYIVLVGRS